MANKTPRPPGGNGGDKTRKIPDPARISPGGGGNGSGHGEPPEAEEAVTASAVPEAAAPAKAKKKKIKAQAGKRGPAWVMQTMFLMLVGCTVIVSAIAALVFWNFSHGLPKIMTVADYRPRGVTRILGLPDPAHPKDEQLLGEFYKERRYVIPYEQIPENVVHAFISAEDDKFFEHGGINISSMIRASIANFRAGRYVQGGSTITQQVAKSLLGTSEKKLGRKIRELILANRIEHTLTKQQILYLYLNEIYLGHHAYGVQAAARTYYRKDVADLTVAEAAVLGGLPQAPSSYSPIVNPKKAKERQLYVLKRMYENHYLTQAQMTEAAAQPLKIFHDEDVNLKYAPYLVEHLRRYLVDKYGEEAVNEGAMTMTVPTNVTLAKLAGRALHTGLELVDKRIGYRGPIQHLEPMDVEKFLVDERVQLIERRVHYQILTPDGKLDPFEAMRVAGLQSEADLLEPDELYQAVVTGVDDRHKLASVIIGAVRAELPLEKMAWARLIKDATTNPPTRTDTPTFPSQVVKKGDVILVKLAPDQKGAGKEAPVVSLEQEPQVQGALVSIEAQTGNVIAMEGGYDFESSEFNRAIQAQRQPGSSFKPIIYSCALEHGYTPSTIIVDSPIVYDDSASGTGKWKPHNFEEKFYGDTTFSQALVHSRNIPSIKITQSLGYITVQDYASRLGIDGKFPSDLSISLGSASVSLLEMTKAYALFPRLGRKVTPLFFSRIYDRDGKLLEEQKPAPMPAQIVIPPIVASDSPAAAPTDGTPPPAAQAADLLGKHGIPMPHYPPAGDPDQVLDPRVASVMTHLMNEVVTFGTGGGAKALGRAAAGKTGTTEDYVDAWFMGFTPTVVTGVWVGFDNQRSIGPLETGARAALPIWLSFMQGAVKNYADSEFTIPPGVVFASIDPTTGKLASPNSSKAIKEAFIEGTQPVESVDETTAPSENQSEFFKEDTE